MEPVHLAGWFRRKRPSPCSSTARLEEWCRSHPCGRHHPQVPALGQRFGTGPRGARRSARRAPRTQPATDTGAGPPHPQLVQLRPPLLAQLGRPTARVVEKRPQLGFLAVNVFDVLARRPQVPFPSVELAGRRDVDRPPVRLRPPHRPHRLALAGRVHADGLQQEPSRGGRGSLRAVLFNECRMSRHDFAAH